MDNLKARAKAVKTLARKGALKQLSKDEIKRRKLKRANKFSYGCMYGNPASYNNWMHDSAYGWYGMD